MTDLNGEWARTQLEAWVDGTLEGESRARMAAAIAADPQLKAAAERAAAVRRALRALPQEPVPAGLRRRLLAIPARSGATRRPLLWPALASAAAAAAVVGISLWFAPTPPAPTEEQAAAMQDLEVAMRYLQKSARITQGQVTSAVGGGLRDAFAATRQALDQDETGG
jgi:anti-sigma factor RsiW